MKLSPASSEMQTLNLGKSQKQLAINPTTNTQSAANAERLEEINKNLEVLDKMCQGNSQEGVLKQMTKILADTSYSHNELIHISQKFREILGKFKAPGNDQANPYRTNKDGPINQAVQRNLNNILKRMNVEIINGKDARKGGDAAFINSFNPATQTNDLFNRLALRTALIAEHNEAAKALGQDALPEEDPVCKELNSLIASRTPSSASRSLPNSASSSSAPASGPKEVPPQVIAKTNEVQKKFTDAGKARNAAVQKRNDSNAKAIEGARSLRNTPKVATEDLAHAMKKLSDRKVRAQLEEIEYNHQMDDLDRQTETSVDKKEVEGGRRQPQRIQVQKTEIEAIDTEIKNLELKIRGKMLKATGTPRETTREALLNEAKEYIAQNNLSVETAKLAAVHYKAKALEKEEILREQLTSQQASSSSSSSSSAATTTTTTTTTTAAAPAAQPAPTSATTTTTTTATNNNNNNNNNNNSNL